MASAACAHCGNAHPEGSVFCPFTGRSLTSSHDSRIGARIGSHTVERVLGAGASGTVYLARNDAGDAVALKILRTESVGDAGRAHRRFEREIRAVQAIRHRNVVRLIESGELPNGTPWLAMELVEGESLRARLDREQRLPVHDVVLIGSAILDALDAAHAAGIVHRDVKPENVLLAQQDGRVVPKLADFGLAQDQGPQITAPGSVVGTPRYISPEQARGKREIDARADLWSVGVLLYEALAGQRPFEGRDVVSTLLAILSSSPPSPATVRPEVPEGISACVMRAIEKEPARRFASAREMKIVLRAAAAAENTRTEEMDAEHAIDELGDTITSGERKRDTIEDDTDRDRAGDRGTR